MDPGLPDDPHGSMGHLPMQGMSITPEMYNVLMQIPGVGLEPRATEMNTRGSWSQTEDESLRNAVCQLGPKKWTDVARFVPNRTSKQCRERWFNRLSPEIKHDPFEPWEDQVILQQQKEFGNRWAIIARHLPGRSSNAIKNRWHSGLKGQHEPLAQISLGGLGVDMLGSQHLPSDMLPPPSELNISIQGDEHDGKLGGGSLSL